jgi:peptidoglycan hydrolase-like protein with peptidoglycan-binding domain
MTRTRRQRLGASSSRAAVWLALAGLLGCAQTRRVAREEETSGRPAPAKRSSEAQKAPSAPRDQRRAAEGQPPVPAQPEKLLSQEGTRRLHEALSAKGYLRDGSGDALDGATSAALRRFQTDEGLAATGFPDRETLRQLGLDPRQVYRTEEKVREEQGR